MTTASKATRRAARTHLGRHPTAVECAKIAAAITNMHAEVVVFDGNRVFIAASTSGAMIMTPRPMTEAECSAVTNAGRAIERIDGDDGSVLVPVRVGGVLIAGLSLFGGRPPNSTDALAGLGRMLAAALAELDHSAVTAFHEKVLAGLRDAVLILSPELELSWLSRGVISLLGHSPLEVVGRSAVDFLHPDDIEATLHAIARISDGLEVYRLVVRVLSSAGSYIPVEVTGTDLTADTDVGGIVLSLRDAQQASELSDQVERSQRLATAIVEGLPDGLVATDRYGGITLANNVARAMFGLDPAAAAGQLDLDMFALSTIDGRPVDLLEDRSTPARCILPHAGEIRYVDCSNQAAATVDGEPFGQVIVFTDVTTEHRAAQELREQALHDQLTGLANRRQMETRLVELAGGPAPDLVAACFVDLDGFKLVNDNHGHRVGDQVIRLAARRLAGELREQDLLVRHGGDEFVALLVGIEDLDRASAVAERARAVLAEPFHVGTERFDLTASIGVAIASTRSLDPEMLLQHADIALYEAKGSGRNRVQVFDESLAELIGIEQQQRRLLRDAIDQDRIVMHFQPLVDSATDRTLGFEALARLETPEGELLSPVHFLDAVAHTGLMWELDQIAFVLSCDAARLLSRIDPARAPYVACNFSSVSLSHPDFVEFVLTTTREAGVSPSQICIEITESAAFDSGNRNAKALRELMTHGYQLALDDFGTGYSSLAHLRDLPITTVKVDRSFIEQLAAPTSERAIAEAVVALARDLELSVVAEGVETLDQLLDAKAMGFHTIQGWHYSKALPIDRCLELWRRSEPSTEVI